LLFSSKLFLDTQISSATSSRTRICGGRCQDFILCRVALMSVQCGRIFSVGFLVFLFIVSLWSCELCTSFLLAVVTFLSCFFSARCLCSWVIGDHVSCVVANDWLSLNVCPFCRYFPCFRVWYISCHGSFSWSFPWTLTLCGTRL